MATVIQAVFFGLCVLIDVSSLLTKGGDSREQERQLRKLIGLRDWMMAVLAFPVGAVQLQQHQKLRQLSRHGAVLPAGVSWGLGVTGDGSRPVGLLGDGGA
ncbi:androgen-induced gene 1 protein isoform X2 [Lates japonicus]|uniref:Androgen-induced gene 1 protein isoform X2 n=1 Tax=Lates japonicus TaxID=270547 RepID=A0AAD3RMF5_LATJO|nr:androgen-induced gene 1 protein isoform X2 [Lates japonicus]